MTTKELKERMKDPVVTDRRLIQRAIEEMMTLPTCAMYKEVLNVSKAPFRSVPLEKMSVLLKLKNVDDLPDTFGELVHAINSYKSKVNVEYGTLLYHLAQLHIGFMINTI